MHSVRRSPARGGWSDRGHIAPIVRRQRADAEASTGDKRVRKRRTRHTQNVAEHERDRIEFYERVAARLSHAAERNTVARQLQRCRDAIAINPAKADEHEP